MNLICLRNVIYHRSIPQAADIASINYFMRVPDHFAAGIAVGFILRKMMLLIDDRRLIEIDTQQEERSRAKESSFD